MARGLSSAKKTASQKRWERLAGTLETMIPAPLSLRQLEAAAAMGADPYAAAPRAELPLVAANFKAAVHERLRAFASARELPTEVGGYGDDAVLRAEPALHSAVRRDLETLARALFGRSRVECHHMVIMAGLFRKARTPALHPDPDDDHRSPYMFLSRLGALPFEMIESRMMPEPIVPASRLRPVQGLSLPELIAQGRHPRGEKARAELRRLGVLKSMPLGAVALAANVGWPGGAGGRSVEGTLHCSSPVPRGKAVASALVRMLLLPGA